MKWRNPDATVADEGNTMQAYFDKERKVWVFPGEDPEELAKPIGPPPTAVKTPQATTPAPVAVASMDPLAAMMAPPQRPPSALRARGATPIALVKSPSPMGGAAEAVATPQFMVFKPKPASKDPKDEKDS